MGLPPGLAIRNWRCKNLAAKSEENTILRSLSQWWVLELSKNSTDDTQHRCQWLNMIGAQHQFKWTVLNFNCTLLPANILKKKHQKTLETLDECFHLPNIWKKYPAPNAWNPTYISIHIVHRFKEKQPHQRPPVKFSGSQAQPWQFWSPLKPWDLEVSSETASTEISSWWLKQPLWTIWVKMGIFPK